jgi:hypothetical protein
MPRAERGCRRGGVRAGRGTAAGRRRAAAATAPPGRSVGQGARGRGGGRPQERARPEGPGGHTAWPPPAQPGPAFNWLPFPPDHSNIHRIAVPAAPGPPPPFPCCTSSTPSRATDMQLAAQRAASSAAAGSKARKGEYAVPMGGRGARRGGRAATEAGSPSPPPPPQPSRHPSPDRWRSAPRRPAAMRRAPAGAPCWARRSRCPPPPACCRSSPRRAPRAPTPCCPPTGSRRVCRRAARAGGSGRRARRGSAGPGAQRRAAARAPQAAGAARALPARRPAPACPRRSAGPPAGCMPLSPALLLRRLTPHAPPGFLPPPGDPARVRRGGHAGHRLHRRRPQPRCAPCRAGSGARCGGARRMRARAAWHGGSRRAPLAARMARA